MPEPIDRKAEARRLSNEAATASKSARGDFLAAALVHSNLAIAEGQERVAEEIKAFRELMGNSAT